MMSNIFLFYFLSVILLQFSCFIKVVLMSISSNLDKVDINLMKELMNKYPLFLIEEFNKYEDRIKLLDKLYKKSKSNSNFIYNLRRYN